VEQHGFFCPFSPHHLCVVSTPLSYVPMVLVVVGVGMIGGLLWRLMIRWGWFGVDE